MEDYESQVARDNFTWDEYAENLTHFARNTSGNGTYFNKFYFYETAQFAVLLVLLVGIVAGNSTVILALLLTKSRKSRMNFFMMQLAIADLWVGLISVPTDMVQRITIVWVAGNWACKLIKFLQGVVTYSSTYVLVALSIDRCDAIRHPMNFTGSWRRARGLIIAAWLLSIAFSLPMLFLFEEKRVQDKLQCWVELESRDVLGRVWVTGVFVSLFIIPALTISACYGIIVVTIRSKSKHALGRDPTRKKQPASAAATRQFSDEVDSRRASSRGIIPKAKIKTVKMTFVIVFAFILCWSPYMIFDLLQVYHCIPTTQTSIAIASLVQSLAPLNSAANPIIYCIFSSRVFVSLRNLPPYKWLWCWRETGGGGTDSRAHTELLTSSHRRTRRDLTITRKKDDSVKVGPGSQKLINQRGSGRQVRLRLPGDNNYVTQPNNTSAQTNNTSAQPNNTSAQPNKNSSQINYISSAPKNTSVEPNKTSPLSNNISSQADKTSSQPNNASSPSNNTSSQPNKTSSPSNNTSAILQNTSSQPKNSSLCPKHRSSPTNNTSLQLTKTSSQFNNISSPNNQPSQRSNYMSQNNNVLRNTATQKNNI